MKRPARRLGKFAKLPRRSTGFVNFIAVVIATAGLVIVSGLFRMKPDFFLEKSAATSEPRSDALGEREAESLRRQESLLRGLPFQQALESMQAQLTQVSSPTKLGKNGILTITDSGILKPTDHNQTQGGIGTDVSRIGKIWGTFMDLKDDVAINGKLDLSGKLTANGVVVLGNNDGDTIEVGGRFTSNLVPSQNNAVDIGTTSLRWRTGYFVNSIVVGSGTTTITGTSIATDQITSNSSALIKLVSTGTLQLDTSTNNTNILLLTGTGNVGIGSTAPAYTLDVSGTGHYTGAVTFDSSISVSDLSCTDCLDFDSFEDSLDMDADTSINGDYSLILRAGAGAVQNSTSGSNDLQLAAEDRLDLYAASYSLTTSGNSVDILSGGRIDLSAKGTLTLDTSQNNTNIVLTPGSGNVGIGSTAPVYKLDVNGTLRTTSTARVEGALTVTTGGASVTGDLTLDGDLDFTGPQNITTTADNLTLSPNGNLIIDTSGGTVSIRDAGIDLTNQPTTVSGSTLTLRSTGTFILDTSANNTELRLQTGSGGINLSGGTTTISGNVNLNSGTLTLNGRSYTFPGSETANGVLLTDGSGILSWNTIGQANVTADSLDFTEFQDSLDMDADTLVNGDYSLILRAGAGAVQNSTSGSNDLQLAAEDKLIFDAASFTLTASSGPIDILSRGYLDLSSTGTLTLDTSQNNSDILLKAGSGGISLSSGTTTISGNVNLNSGTLTLNGVAYTFPGADGTSSQALTTNGSGILSWSTIGVSGDSLDFTDFKDVLTMDSDTAINGDYSFILRAGLGARQDATSGSNDLQLSAEDQMFIHAGGLLLETSSASAGQMVLRADGTLTLDTSANNTNILLLPGTGSLGIGTAAPVGLVDILGGGDVAMRLTGDNDFLLRVGDAAAENLTNGNDIMAAAEDQMFFRAGGFNLTTSSSSNDSIVLRSGSGGIQLSTGSGSLGELRLLSAGSLVLDTSLNGTNISLLAGSGRIDLSGNAILLNSGTGTLTLSSESGVTVGNGITAEGNINSKMGALQTNGVTRIDNSGNLTAATATITDLKISGQASAPGSPTEGQIYYDSDNYEFYGYKNAQWSRLLGEDRGSCPAGYILVPGSATFGTEDFCVMKYEAKQDANKNPESVAAGTPWVSVDWYEAKAACNRAGAHLITPAEWMTIARNIESLAINDMDDDAGVQMATGHSDNAPAAAQASSAGSDPVVSGCTLTSTMENAANAYSAASCEIQGDGSYGGDDTDKGFYGTSQAWSATGYSAGAANKSQLRTHVLSNGNVIWDFAGNVWEWSDWQCSANVWYNSAAWIEWNNANLTDYEQAAGGSTSNTSTNGAGRYYGCSATGNAAIRGGSWSDGASDGPFSLALNNAPSAVNTDVGFRCAK